MFIKIFVLVVYALGLFAVGWWARARWSATPENYFLANRALGPLILLATMAATNFSAFTVFGASGAGYRDGFAFYPIVGFGTGFMALGFWFIGRKARQLGERYAALTPPDLVRHLYDDRMVSTLFAAVLIIFTIPYLALQPMAAGYALKELLGLNHAVGAGLVTVVICSYTLRGGLRAVAWTDALQGLIMFGVLAAALILIAQEAGGLTAAGRELISKSPELFSRPGGQGKFTPFVWFSFIFLWFFCDPMFPQLFQRFLAARDERAIRRTMMLYPLVCSAVFLLPVTIGVLGHLQYPDLAGKAADRILPLLAADMKSEVFGSLIIACGLAALMSTMDSQLLTLSSIFSQDMLPLAVGGSVKSAWPGRAFVVVLAGAGLAMAIHPPATILTIARYAFTGLAVLFPTVIFGLYPGWRSSKGALVSILTGEAALALDLLGYLPTGGFLAVVPIMGLSFGSYLVTAAVERSSRGLSLPLPADFLASPFTWGFVAVFILSQDWWRWGQEPGLIWIWPAWTPYFLLLSLLQTVLMAFWSRPAERVADSATSLAAASRSA